MEDTELRDRLQALAYRTAPPPRDADELTGTVVSLHRTRRRRQVATGVAAVAAVAVAMSVPAVRSGLGRDGDPAAPPPPAGVYTTPTRGELSDQPAFLDGMLRRPWTSGPAGDDVVEAPLDTRRVVYATERLSGRWVLVAGADPAALPPADGVDPADLDAVGSVAIAWFTGPWGGAPEEMRVYGEPRVVDSEEPTAVLSPTAPYRSSSEALTIVVGAPGDRLQSSGIRWVEPDGEIGGGFDPDSDLMADGVLAHGSGQVDASINRSDRFRVLRDATAVPGVIVTEPRPDFVPPDVDLRRLRPAPPPHPGDTAVATAIDELLSYTGLWAPVLTYTVLWAGDLPSTDGAGARLSVLAAEFDEGGRYAGAAYLTGALGWESDGQVSSASCGSEVRPAGVPPGEQVVVLRCRATTDPPTDTLVVVAPSTGFPTARTVAGGRVSDEVPLTDGVGFLPVPAGPFEVEVVDTNGDGSRYAPMGEVDWGA